VRSPLPHTHRARHGWLAALLLLPGLGAAQSLSGVGAAFRPQALPPAPVVAPASASAAGSSGAAADPAGNSGLRVLVTGGSRQVASIDGRLVRVGDTVNGMRVVQIGPKGVVLKGEGGVREQLSPSPAAQKRPANSTRVPTGARP
jgi:hypothetical protein